MHMDNIDSKDLIKISGDFHNFSNKLKVYFDTIIKKYETLASIIDSDGNSLSSNYISLAENMDEISKNIQSFLEEYINQLDFYARNSIDNEENTFAEANYLLNRLANIDKSIQLMSR